MAVAYVVLEPHNIDVAAHRFRADLFGREGLTIWNGQWYAGHHTPHYSVLFPPIAWLIGPWAAGAIGAVAAAVLFEPLVRRHFGPGARWGALWFGLGTGSMLFTGRLPFALGTAIGLGALLALQRRRRAVAAALALLCSLASPVAGLFLALAGIALWLSGPGPVPQAGGRDGGRREGLPLALAALVPPAALSIAFPGGGYEPFHYPAFRYVPLFAVLSLLVLPTRERALRIGVALYGLATVAAFVVETPMGANAVRLGALFGGPVLACAIARPGVSGRRRLIVAALLPLLALWQLSPAFREYGTAREEPSVRPSYFEPLVRFLERQNGSPGRVEVVFTKGHWEAAEVAGALPIARGWERQLDVGRHRLFYDDDLTDDEYSRWLAENGVRFVALPDSEVDYSAEEERDLVRREPPYLRRRFASEHWTVYEVTPRPRLVVRERGAAMTLERLGSDELTVNAAGPGSALLRVRYTPYWRARGACVEPVGEWTRLVAARRGRIRVSIAFSPERVVSRGRRCG